MHAAQSLPRRCTRASAVHSDVSGGPHVRSVYGVFAKLNPCYGPADKQLPKRRNSDGGRAMWGRGDKGKAGRAGRLAFALLITATLFTAGLVDGQNLAPNAEFDTDVPPWSTGLGDSSVVWTGLDHDGCDEAISGLRSRRTTPPTRRRVVASRPASPTSFPARSMPSAPTSDFRPGRRGPVPRS